MIESWPLVFFTQIFSHFSTQKLKRGFIGDQKEIKESEFRDALLQLEEDNFISMVGHKQRPTIRSYQSEPILRHLTRR